MGMVLFIGFFLNVTGLHHHGINMKWTDGMTCDRHWNVLASVSGSVWAFWNHTLLDALWARDTWTHRDRWKPLALAVTLPGSHVHQTKKKLTSVRQKNLAFKLHLTLGPTCHYCFSYFIFLCVCHYCLFKILRHLFLNVWFEWQVSFLRSWFVAWVITKKNVS
jgi:hypothetical protein